MSKRKKKVISAIKQMEAKKRVKATPIVDEQVHFDIWWAQKVKVIPQGHAKEVIRANFKSWGLGKFATAKEFDAALVKYGIIV